MVSCSDLWNRSGQVLGLVGSCVADAAAEQTPNAPKTDVTKTTRKAVQTRGSEEEEVEAEDEHTLSFS